MKRYVFITIQGVMTWALDKKYEEDWENTFLRLKTLKDSEQIHPRIFPPSRKLLKSYQDQGFPAPTDFQIRNDSDLLIIWGHKGQYLEALIGLDKRKTPDDYALKTVSTNFNHQ